MNRRKQTRRSQTGRSLEDGRPHAQSATTPKGIRGPTHAISIITPANNTCSTVLRHSLVLFHLLFVMLFAVCFFLLYRLCFILFLRQRKSILTAYECHKTSWHLEDETEANRIERKQQMSKNGGAPSKDIKTK